MVTVTIIKRARRIEKARARRNLTLADMNQKLKVAKQTYISIENGDRDVACDMLSKIAAITEVNESWLFNGAGRMVG